MNNLVETQTKNEVKSLDECLVISEKSLFFVPSSKNYLLMGQGFMCSIKRRRVVAIRPFMFAIACYMAGLFAACSSSDTVSDTPQREDDAKKALLIILDGWGIGDKSEGDVIYQTSTPYMTTLMLPIPTPCCRLLESMSVCLMVRWATRRRDISILVPDVSSIRI